LATFRATVTLRDAWTCSRSSRRSRSNEFLIEAGRLPGNPLNLPEIALNQVFARDRRLSSAVPHVWRWDSLPHIDMKKEIDAYAEAVRNNFCTQQYVAQEVFGQDGNEVIIERGIEVALEKDNGVPVAPPQNSEPGNITDEDEDIVHQSDLEETSA
jgi:hypothetical protein